MHRVLNADGVVAMSEPGQGHAASPTSIAETAATGVLENELVIEDIAALAEAVGFREVNVLAEGPTRRYEIPVRDIGSFNVLAAAGAAPTFLARVAIEGTGPRRRGRRFNGGADVAGDAMFPAVRSCFHRRLYKHGGKPSMHMHMRFLTVSALTAGLCAGTGDVRAQGSVAFSRVVTQPNVFVDNVAAVADLDGDGRDDVIAFKSLEYNVAREDRLTKSPLRLFVSVGDGSFRHAPELVEGTIDVRFPIVVADDFNGDGRADLAVFDGGVYVVAESVGVGNPPQLFLSSPDGRLRSSSALADAVRREHALRPNPDMVRLAQELGLARLGKLSIDGTKVRANASKRKAMSYDRMQEEEQRLESEIEALLRQADAVDEAEDARLGAEVRGDDLPAELRRREERLAAIREAKARLEAAARAADDARGRQPGQDRNPKGGRPYKRAYGEPDEKAQSNFTDPESSIMKTSNEGFQQCYNAQVTVDAEHQLVVATDLTANASDQGELPVLLDAVKETFAAQPETVLADAGYCNERDLTDLEKRGIDGYVALGPGQGGPTAPAPVARPGALVARAGRAGARSTSRR